MTEFETIEALSNLAANAATFFTVFLSMTFGYLTAAYLVGADLTRFQCFVIAGIYFLSPSVFGAAAITCTSTGPTLKARETSVIDDVWIANAVSWSGGAWVIVVVMILLSLYFMYNVRSTTRKS